MLDTTTAFHACRFAIDDLSQAMEGLHKVALGHDVQNERGFALNCIKAAIIRAQIAVTALEAPAEVAHA